MSWLGGTLLRSCKDGKDGEIGGGKVRQYDGVGLDCSGNLFCYPGRNYSRSRTSGCL